jgi:hypothetical protein
MEHINLIDACFQTDLWMEKVDQLGKNQKNDENNEWWMLDEERNCHGIFIGQKSGSFATEY